MNVVVLGIDLAKSTFSLHGVDAHGHCVLRKTLSRSRLLAFVAQRPPCFIGLEACSGAHYWAREFERLGHRVGIMAAKFVSPYRTNGKNDHNDAQAICEAVSRPSMRFAAVKSEAQQAVLSLHRVRTMLVKERTALINQLRGLLSEFGIVMPQGREQAQLHVARLLGDEALNLPVLFKRLLADLYQRLTELHRQLLAYDRELESLAERRGYKRAIVALAAKNARIVWALLTSEKSYEVEAV